MPELVGDHEFLNNRPLKLVSNLLSVERPSGWEGWLTYEIKLYNGDQCLISLSNVTILSEDAEELIRKLAGDKPFEFEPTEPDFHMFVRPSIPREFAHSVEGLVELLIFIDEGKNREQGYAGQGIGFRMLLDPDDLKRFAHQLELQHRGLTRGLRRAS